MARSVEGVVTRYGHGLIALAMAAGIMFFVLNFLHTRGPAFIQPYAGRVGGLVSGQAYTFR